MQDNARVNTPTVQAVLNALCKREPRLLRKNGEINHNELARMASVNQPTVTRILSGESATPKRGNALKLASVFGLTAEQILGLQQIPGLFEPDNHEYPISASGPPTGVPSDELGAMLSEMSEDSLVEFILGSIPHLQAGARALIAEVATAGLQELIEPDK